MAQAVRARKINQKSQTGAALLEEIKENCAHLKNINLKCLKGGSLIDQVSQLASMVPQSTKRQDLHKLCHQQECKILTSLQKNTGYSIYREIEKVNPKLRKELDESRNDELVQKLEHYKKVQQLPVNSSKEYSIDIEESSIRPSFDEIFKDQLLDVDLAYLFDKQTNHQGYGINTCQMRQITNEPSQRYIHKTDFNQVHNLMDDLENLNPQTYSKHNISDPHDYNDFFIKKYFDLN